MPRTKAVKKNVKPPCKIAQLYLPVFEANVKSALNNLREEQENYMNLLLVHMRKSKLSIPANILNKTMGELMERPLNWSGECTSTDRTISQILETTKTEKRRKQVTRTSSLGDEAESSKSTSGGRTSRSRSRLQKPKRQSRSVSSRPDLTAASSDRYRTPANKAPPASYGTVTPKVKPNTPQVLLRRPKLGEVALSLQGSPLLTGAVMSDNVANINIPLEDGRLLSIQPQRGLRISQIPELDKETKRQLETLRDNLNKVCALSGKR